MEGNDGVQVEDSVRTDITESQEEKRENLAHVKKATSTENDIHAGDDQGVNIRYGRGDPFVVGDPYDSDSCCDCIGLCFEYLFCIKKALRNLTGRDDFCTCDNEVCQCLVDCYECAASCGDCDCGDCDCGDCDCGDCDCGDCNCGD